jgi:PAS domain S-box-containing protein
LDAKATTGPEVTGNERFRLLVESVKDYAIFLLDPAGVVASWNGGAERIKGYRAHEIIGEHFSKFYPPKDVAAGKCEMELEVALREGRFEDYGWRVRKDGSQFWANVIITTLRDETGKHVGFAKVTRDLTDLAYRAFVEATNAIVWTADEMGRANADSPSWRAFTGQTAEEWLGQQGWEPVHPDDRPSTAVKWAAAKAEAKHLEAEFRMRRHDGVYVWMAARATPFLKPDGTVREWFGVTFDISSRKAAEAIAAQALERERAARLEAEEARSFWTTTLRSIGDAVVATDTGGRVTFMNPIAETLTGWSADEARGRPLPEVFSIFNEDSRQPVPNPVEKVLREGTIVGLANHTMLARRDGTEIPIDDSAAPILDPSGSLFGVVLVFRDVTEDKRAAARREYLLRAGETLAAASDHKDALATIVELAVPRIADWCAVDVLDPGESTSTQIAVAHVDPAKVAFARDLGRRYPPNPKATSGVPNVLRTGRSELYPEIPPALLEAGAVDEEHLRLIRELQLRSAIVVPLRGRERIFGALTFVYAESGRRYGEDDLLFAEELARRAALVIERRKLEDERATLLEAERRARKQAEIANRAKDDFLATTSHELRNPLQAILGWAKLLLQRDLPPDLRKPLMTIERNARTQARLIEDVLDVARIISGKMRLELGRASIASAIADALEAARPAADAKGITLASHVEPGAEIDADQVRLQQIVSNLVSNAVKFTPNGGLVSVDAEHVGPNVRITVHDTGEGIDPAMLTDIFEPFRQENASTTRRQGGLGLGLAIVRQLVLAHGGDVRAESPGKGRGSTFVIDFPARPSGRTPERDRHASERSALRLPGTRVLVVDDQADALELIHDVLAEAGAEVVTAQSASEALEKLLDFHPDVLVSDIGMPDVDGYGLIRRVRRLGTSTGGRTPAVALTAYAGADDAERCFAAGFQNHLPKPVDPEQLVRVVANLAGLPLQQEA